MEGKGCFKSVLESQLPVSLRTEQVCDWPEGTQQSCCF